MSDRSALPERQVSDTTWIRQSDRAEFLALLNPELTDADFAADDLITAATAVATGRTVLTTDRNARFEDLPGVDCILVT